MKNIGLPFLLMLCSPIWIIAQVDTILNLSEIEVSAPKMRIAPIGTQIIEWNSDELQKINAQNVGELIERQTPVFIKSYGLGSLATSSVRGGSAGHTLVLWNGMPIQSPMLGLLDLSLLPTNTTESISFQKGGNSALWGSGAIGGVISLNNQPDFSNKTSVQNNSLIGSFGTFEQQLHIGLGNENFQSVSKVFYNKADNDFPYFPASNLPEKTQENAHLTQWNFLQNTYWKINSKNRIEAHIWRQNSDRQIPPLTTQTKSLAHQDDIATRLNINWQRIDNQLVSTINIGLFDEHNNYFDDLISLEARNRFRSLIGEINIQKTLNDIQKIFVGSTHSITKAWSDGYASPPIENRTALFASYKMDKDFYDIQASLRQEISDGKWVPLIPTLGVNFKLTSYLKWQFKIGKNYRLPTLNDRFWNPGGNPNLLPESGWSYESTIRADLYKNDWNFEIQLTGFNRLIKNQILWTPVEGEFYWAPHNISKVWSRGLESQTSINYHLNNFEFGWHAGYDFIRASNQISLTLPKIERGEQLIYTPIHQVSSSISLTWKEFYMNYQHSFTSKIKGVNENLDNYQIGNFRFQYSTKIRGLDSSIFLNLNNVWGTEYFVIERRPMPKRYFLMGVRVSFNRTN